MYTRYRKRINEKVDEKLLEKLDLISKLVDVPKSRIVEEGIKFILKKQIEPIEKSHNRKSINLTLNSSLWNNLKSYCDSNNYKIVFLLEQAITYSIKKYKRKLNIK